MTEPSNSLVPVDNMDALPAEQQAAAVVDMLDRARSWLADAVEATGPAEITAAKAHIVTAETYAKQLGLSKEIQQDAKEMVRRAEYALGKAIRKGQEEGTIATRSDNKWTQRSSDSTSYTGVVKASPTDFAPRYELTGQGGEDNGLYALARADEAQFEEAIAEAKAEGNLSRANVVRKVKGERAPRRSLSEAFFDAICQLRKDVERVDRLTTDDRFARNREISDKYRPDLIYAIDLLTGAVDRFPNPTEERP